MTKKPTAQMFQSALPDWAMLRPKPLWQSAYDLVGAPLRMLLLPDHVNEGLHLTSLRAERFSVVLDCVEGRLLDVGAGDNSLVRLYEKKKGGTDRRARASVGVDVFDWGGGCTIVQSCREMPFADQSFDTVTFIACLNHIPERNEGLREAYRVLRPGGKLVVTMIGRLIGELGHALWWYSEDKNRDLQQGELMGMNSSEVTGLMRQAGFADVKTNTFVYGLNSLYTAIRPQA